jgi:prephenate dehydrogenase
VALTLGEAGWEVSGWDLDESALARARDASIISGSACGDECELIVVATPAGTVSRVANEALAANANARLFASTLAGLGFQVVREQ